MGQASWPKSSRKGIGVYTPTIPIPLLLLLHLYSQTSIVVSAYRRISKDQKHKCRCPPVQSAEEGKLQKHQITSKVPEDSNIFSSPSITNPSGIFLLTPFLGTCPESVEYRSAGQGKCSWSAGELPMRRRLDVAKSMDGDVYVPMASINLCQ